MALPNLHTYHKCTNNWRTVRLKIFWRQIFYDLQCLYLTVKHFCRQNCKNNPYHCDPCPRIFDTYVVGMSIEKLFDMWRNDEILKYYVICAAVSALSWLSQFCTSKKKHWNRLRENSKIRHFVISSHLFYWHANHIRIQNSFFLFHPREN